MPDVPHAAEVHRLYMHAPEHAKRNPVTAHFVEHIDRYPDCGWISEEETWDDPNWFEHGLIRNLAAALAKIEAD